LWLEDEEVGGRGFLRRAYRGSRLNVKVGGRRRVPASPTTRLLVVGGLVAAAFVGWLTWRWLVGVLFIRNPAYQIANLEIRGGGELASYFIREKKGITEGTNIFAFSIAEIREEFLSQRYSSKYKSMEISRILPDTLRVEVIGRVPLARLAYSGNLVADAEGWVFGVGTSGKPTLPVITGYGGAPLRPGDRVQGGLRDALTMLDLLEKTGIGRDILITTVDVRGGFSGKRDDMKLIVNGETEVILWWPRREPQGGTENLRERLMVLRTILRSARQEGRRLRTVNLSLEDYKANCPVTYWE